jgi:rRNA small subunit pseudouridine methyltransferase Nep1
MPSHRDRGMSPPKRRASNSAHQSPWKASKMSADAPEFKPRTSFKDDRMSDDEDAAVAASGSATGGSAPLSAEAREALTAAVAHARVTRPLPNSRRTAAAANMVPQAATVPKTNAEKDNKRRLIVVLSQVSLVCRGASSHAGLRPCGLYRVAADPRPASKHTRCRAGAGARTPRARRQSTRS